MSRKTFIYLVACAELCLGTYFMLGFLAWLVKIFFLDAKHTTSPATLLIWLVLAGGCFWLYVIAWRKTKEIEQDLKRPQSPEPKPETPQPEEKTTV
jgi:hypothetical protein